MNTRSLPADHITPPDAARTGVYKNAGYTLQDEFEDPKLYVKGGFHPVRVGDIYSHYEIVRKLGCGSYSTVWLAEDLTYNPRSTTNVQEQTRSRFKDHGSRC